MGTDESRLRVVARWLRSNALRTVAGGVLVGLLVVPVACTRRAESPIAGQSGAGQCQAIAWGGWDGTPACSGLASTVVTGAHRACSVDTDCMLAGTTRCTAHAVNHYGAQSFAETAAPCVHPLSGMCPPVQWIPRCQQGCCVPSRQ